MKIKTVSWTPKGRFLEVKYADGVVGTISAPEDWGEFRGLHESPDPTNGSNLMWEYNSPHPYDVYCKVKANADAQSSLSQSSWDRRK